VDCGTIHVPTEIKNKFKPLENKNYVSSSYYTEKPITPQDYIRANESWRLIVDNKGQKFLTIRKKQGNKYNNYCVVWFYEILYDYLFYLLPDVKVLFPHDIDKQGRMLVSMINLILESFYNHSLINKIKDLTIRHINYGVKLYHFYIMGEVLLYTLNEVLGEEFTEECFVAWKKIYSSMLRIIIPIYHNKEENYVLGKIHQIHEKIPSNIVVSNKLSSISVEK